MKKFERLPVEERKEEIKAAAVRIFLEKGFPATTMENIVEEVSLSKGGVYRIYPSTKAILADIILDGARWRNGFYRERAVALMREGKSVDIQAVMEIISDGMICLPEVAQIYAEFLIEKRRSPELEALYQEICLETGQETLTMIEQLGLGDTLGFTPLRMRQLEELMNTVILGISILNLWDNYEHFRDIFMSALAQVFN